MIYQNNALDVNLLKQTGLIFILVSKASHIYIKTLVRCGI